MAFWEDFQKAYKEATATPPPIPINIAQPKIVEGWEVKLKDKGYTRQAQPFANLSNYTKFATTTGDTFHVQLTCCSCKVAVGKGAPEAISKHSLTDFITKKL